MAKGNKRSKSREKEEKKDTRRSSPSADGSGKGDNNSRSEKRKHDSSRSKVSSDSPRRKTKLFIRDLPADTTEEQVKHEVEQYAKVIEVTMRKREKNGNSMAIIIIVAALKDGEKIKDQLVQRNKWEIQVQEIYSDEKKSRSRERDRDYKENKDKDKEREKERERDKEREREKEQRERDRDRERDRKDREREKDKRRSRTRSRDKKRHRRSTSSSEKRHTKKHSSGKSDQLRHNQDSRDHQKSHSKSQQKSTTKAQLISQNNGKQESNKEDNSVTVVVSSGKARGEVRVRELWLGNLPETITEKKLYSHFFIYGEIEKIEINPHKSYPFYAFVRFKLTSCTSRAFDQSQGLEIDGYKIKVQFSDYNKRPEIVGDIPGYDLTFANCTTLFVAFSVNTSLPSQEKVEEVFQRYGKVRAIYMKQTTPNTQYRPHAFIDYYDNEDTKKAKEDMFNNDSFGTKRAELGDKSCEILYAIKKRCKDFGNPQLGPQSQNPQQQFQTVINNVSVPHQPQQSNMMAQQNQQSQMEAQHIIQTLQQSPDFQKIMQQNPGMAQNLINQVYADPGNAKTIIENYIAQISAGQLSINQNQSIGKFQGNQQMAYRQPSPMPIQQNYGQYRQPFNYMNRMVPPNNQMMIQNPHANVYRQNYPANQMPMNYGMQTQQMRMMQPMMQQPQGMMPHPQQMPSNIYNDPSASQFYPMMPPQVGNQNVPDTSVTPIQQNDPSQQIIANLINMIKPNSSNPEQTSVNPYTSLGQQNQAPSLNVSNNTTIQPNTTNPADISDILALITKNREKSLEQQQQQRQQQEEQEKKNRVEPDKKGDESRSKVHKSIFDDDETFIWSGFITRNKQHRVGVDAYKVTGDHNEQFLCEYNLNVSHRTGYEDIEKYQIQGIVAFIPQNETQQVQFDEYVDYFQRKERMGMVYLKNGLMFLVPPCDASKRYFTDQKNHMIGIFIDQQSAALQAAKFSGMNQQQMR